MCPVLQESSPNNGSSYFSHTGNIVLIFNEDIFAGTGNFVISNGSDSQTISVNDEKQVVINGRVVTINPTNDLLENSHYNMTFLPNVLTDKVGNNFAGLTLPTQLNFYTHSISSTLKDTFSTGKNLTEKLNAKALDGYLKNATVFADANGDGIQNADEATTTTDENGNFELINAKGTLVVSGGIDLSTGNAFEGTLKAPEGSVVVTPLTTVLQGFIDEKQTPAEAKKSVAKAFGFDSTVDLTSYDPISEMINSTRTPSTQTAATQIMASSAQIVNFLVTAGRVLQGAAGDNGNLSTKDANDALLKSLVTSIKEGNGAISMNDSALLKTVLVNGAKEANAQAQAGGLPPKFDATNFTDKIGKMADTVTAVLKEAADNIINAVNKSNTEQPLTLLKNMDKISTFAQNDAGKSLQQAAIELDIKDDIALQKALQNQVKLLTGLPAKQAIENNNVQTEKAVPTILAAGTQNPVQPNPNNPNTNSPNTPPGTNNSTAPNANDSGTPPSTATPPNSNNPNTNSPNTPPGTNNSTAPNTNDSGTPPSTTTPPNSNNPNTNSPNTPPGTNNSTAPNANDSGTPPSTATPPNSNNPNTNSPNTPPSTNNPIAPTNDSGALSDTQLPHDAPPLIGVVGTPNDHIA
ncbi:MAG TPA: hypothetical protein DF614_06990 [Methylococcaceae bacterium]|nr:hypothetical protein [Methylococcaceae bacterium]